MTLTATPQNASNPYASPKEVSELSQPATAETLPAPSFVNALCRWTLICSASAISSFILGLGIDGQPLSVRIFAMIAGIICFSVAYAFLDRTAFWRRLMTDPVTRKSIYAAYGIRMVASVIVPIGAFNDTIVFMLACFCFFAPLEYLGGGFDGGVWDEPYITFAMTVCQGVALNLQMAIGVAAFAMFGRAFSNPTTATERFLGGESRVLKVD